MTSAAGLSRAACSSEPGDGMAAEPRVQVRRAYDAPSADDGRRILVDRLWPRGLAKDAAHVDEWLKAVAPSSELRRWYGHDPAKFDQFRRRYAAELREPERAQALMRLKQEAGRGHGHPAHRDQGRLPQPGRGAGRAVAAAADGTRARTRTCPAIRPAGCTASARPAARSRRPTRPPPARSAAPRSLPGDAGRCVKGPDRGSSGACDHAPPAVFRRSRCPSSPHPPPRRRDATQAGSAEARPRHPGPGAGGPGRRGPGSRSAAPGRG